MARKNPIAVMEAFLNQKMTDEEKVVFDAAVKKEALPQQSESQITQSCVKWFRLQYQKYSSVLVHPANEGARSTRVIANKYGTRVVSTGGARLKAEGLVPGVADLLLLVPRGGYGCLAIEMKRPSKKSKQRDTQIEWEKECTKAGNRYVVCRSLEEFMKAVNDYMSLGEK